ncbi:MAG: WYL domain-containing protein [Alphaproteobacteria bacterium]|nr:WYL domain-containing protein [Alphaproteobacteria bacterium]
MSNKLRRCVRLMNALQSRSRITNRDVREILDCDEQTARRDIQSLIDAGVPLEPHGTGPETHYSISAQWRHAGLLFSMGDAMALHFGRQLLDFLEGTTIPDWLDELRDKLGVRADPKTIEKEHRLARKLVYLSEPYRPYAAHDETLNMLLTAVVDERELTAEYRARGGTAREFRLWPISLVIYRRALYILARDIEADRMLRLAVDRFESATVGDPFTWSDCPDPRELVRDSYGIVDLGDPSGEVRLRFQPEVVDLVRARHWHPTERFEDGPDGTVDLVMDTHGPELARMALEWGDRVEVIEPEGLRRRVREELAGALARYVNGSVE